MAVSYEVTNNKISARLNSMISKARDPRAFLRSVIYPMYIEAQKVRWETENSSETGRWKDLDKKYIQTKLKKFSGFPGGGKAVMVATGKLADVAQGKYGLKRIITTTGMTITLEDDVVPYAKYAAFIRPVMRFGEPTILKIKDKIGEYLMRRG